MIDKNNYEAIDLTRSVESGEDADLFNETSFLGTLERSEKSSDGSLLARLKDAYSSEVEEAYADEDYTLEEYMKFDPGVELAGVNEHEERRMSQEKAFARTARVSEVEKEEEVVSDNEEPSEFGSFEPTEDEMEDMYRAHVLGRAESYGIQNRDEVDFDNLAEAVSHLDDLYHQGKISMPVKVNGSLVVNEKGEVVVAGVSKATDWVRTTDAASDMVKNLNYDADLE